MRNVLESLEPIMGLQLPYLCTRSSFHLERDLFFKAQCGCHLLGAPLVLSAYLTHHAVIMPSFCGGPGEPLETGAGIALASASFRASV